MIYIKKYQSWYGILGSCMFHGIMLCFVLLYQNKPNIPPPITPVSVNVELVASDNSGSKSVAKNTQAMAKATKSMIPIKTHQKIPQKTPVIKTVHKITPPQKIITASKPPPRPVANPPVASQPVANPSVKTDTLITDTIAGVSATNKTHQAMPALGTAQKSAPTQKQATGTGETGTGNKSAVAVYQPKAKYTATMLRQRMKGVVAVKLFFDIHGKVADYQLMKRTRYHILNQAVVSACRQYRIKPPQKAGKPTEYSDLCIQEMNYN